MRKLLKILTIILIFALIAFGILLLLNRNTSVDKSDPYIELKKYLSIIYGENFLIPEFDNINDADENWLWENVSRYLWANDNSYEDKNKKSYGYTYEEISEIVNILYGTNLTKKFPTGPVAMRYDYYNDKYGPTAYGFESKYDYKIDSIEKNGNLYTISIYDFVVSYYRTLGDNPDNVIDIFNIYDFLLNGDNGTPIISVSDLNSSEYQALLEHKKQLSHKVLTFEYDEKNDVYHIISCHYLDTKPEDILATYYSKMEDTFETYYIDYDYDDVYTQEEMIVNNFDELISLYTENAVDTYKKEMNLFVYKDNGDVYITAGSIDIRAYISQIKFENIQANDNEISCTVIRTFRNSFDPGDDAYNETYNKIDNFSIIKQSDNTWQVQDFHYNNLDASLE